ncbi:MAG: T9SS type A sorting domain-containing protein [Flavobacteriales bacterium]
MKKIYQTALFACLCNIAMAQTFFVPTTYRGAFEPGVAMWTDGWTNWDPQNAVYSNPTDTIKTSITTNTTWTSNKTYILSGQIYVKNGATLTIQPGTVIMGNKASTGAGLFICQGSKINAKGTAAQPIVFTSNQAPGSRAMGDWGGIILLGRASNNQPNGVANIEGLAPTPETQHGGGLTPDDADNSGTLSYVRIEWGGYVYQQDKEINGLTLGSIGNGTTIDHIQVSFSNDDAFEWFGGTVDCKYLVSYRNLDDDFDTDFGYRGKVQFGLSVRDPQIADNPSVSTSEGFESDNDASGSTKTPQTSAIFSNMTLIGPYRGDKTSTIAAGYRRGARIRRNSALKIYNSIFMDHQRGVHIDGALCVANAQNGDLKFRNNIVAGNSAGKVMETTAGFPFANMATWFTATSKNDSAVTSANILTTPYNYLTPDYRPITGSIALSGADFTDAGISAYVLAAPNVTANVSYCKGATASELSATAGTGGTLWWYTDASGGTGSTTAPTPSTSAVGTTTYYVSQSNIYGNESSRAAITVTVNALPVVTITAKGSTSLCTGSSVVLKSSSATGNVWTTTATSDSIIVSTSGAYTVTVTDGNNCTATSPATVVNVSSAPKPTVNVSGALTFCEGDSVVLTSSTADSYQWANSAGTSKSIVVKTSGTYHVTTTNTDACAGVGQSDDLVISVGTVPVAAGSYSVVGGVVTFTNTSSGATSYTWDFDDFSTSSATAPVHAYASNGVYNIVLTAWKGSCSDTATMTFKLDVGITEIGLNKGTVSIYPNPTREQATFELNLNERSAVSVNVYDITGKLVTNVYQGEMSAGINKVTMNTTDLRSGIYFTTISSDNAQTTVKMIVE